MRHVALILVVMMAAIVLTACAGGQQRSPFSTEYRTGSQALEMQFLQPRIQVFERDEMALVLEYYNRGTADITDGQFFVKGYDPAYITLNLDPNDRFQIDGKSEFDPRGDFSQSLVIRDSSVRMPANRGSWDQELQVVACYVYRTEASIPVCIDPDPSNTRVDQKVCQGRPVGSSAQGHPVAVTYVEPRVSRNDIRFNIEVQNVGNGIVFDKRISNEKCAYDMGPTDMNKVFIDKVSFSNKVLDCAPLNPVTLQQSGRGLLACTCHNCINPLDGAYQTALTVELSYGYRNVRSAFVTVLAE